MHKSSADIEHGIHYNIFAQMFFSPSAAPFFQFSHTLCECVHVYHSQFYAKIQASFNTRCQSDCTKVVQVSLCYRFMFGAMVFFFFHCRCSVIDGFGNSIHRKTHTHILLSKRIRCIKQRHCGNSRFRFGDIYILSLQRHVISPFRSMQLTTKSITFVEYFLFLCWLFI